jgi:hypothetical protein
MVGLKSEAGASPALSRNCNAQAKSGRLPLSYLHASRIGLTEGGTYEIFFVL